MSTQLFLLLETGSSVPDYVKIKNGQPYTSLTSTALSWSDAQGFLGTSRGNGDAGTSTWNTVTGPTPGIDKDNFGAIVVAYQSPLLSAAATISGTITCNIWASESSMNANAAINFRFLKWDCRTGNVTEFAKTARTTELGTTIGVNNFTVTPTSTAFGIGDRIVVVPFIDDAGTMASGFTATYTADGTTAGASGDTYVTFTENLTFSTTTPTGTTVYPTTTAASGGFSPDYTAPSSLTAFTTANENPISLGGTWSNLDTSLAGSIQITSNQAAPTSTSFGAYYYNVQNYGPDVSAYCTVAATSSGIARLAARIQGEGGSATWDGYCVSANTNNGNWQIARVDNGTLTTLLASASSSMTWSNGDKLGISCLGNRISLWYMPNGGSVWQRLGTAIDTTYTSAGKVGLMLGNNTSLRIDDLFVGGTQWDFAYSGGTEQEAWTSRGGSSQTAVTNTVTGQTSSIQVTDTAAGSLLEWYTRPLTAFTLSGPVLINHRVRESSSSASLTFLCEIAVVNSDGTSPIVWAMNGWGSTSVGAPGTTDAAGVFWMAGPDTAVTSGQRLRIRWFIDDAFASSAAQAAMATGFTGTLTYNGASGGAAGDTFLTFSNTLTELTTKSPPFRHNRRCMIVR